VACVLSDNAALAAPHFRLSASGFVRIAAACRRDVSPLPERVRTGAGTRRKYSQIRY